MVLSSVIAHGTPIELLFTLKNHHTDGKRNLNENCAFLAFIFLHFNVSTAIMFEILKETIIFRYRNYH